MDKQHSIWEHGLKFGGFLSVFLIIVTVIGYLAGVDNDNNTFGLVSYVLLFFGIGFSILQYRNNYLGGYIEFGKAFSVGFVTGFISAVIVGVFLYLFYSFIAPDALQIDEDLIVQKLQESNPDMTDEMIEMSLSYAKKFMTPFWTSFITVFWSTGMSALFALLSALFTKKENFEEGQRLGENHKEEE